MILFSLYFQSEFGEKQDSEFKTCPMWEEPQRKACAILAPHPRTEPLPPAVEAWSLNQWTTREVLFPTPYVLIFKNWLCYFQASWYIFSRYVTVLTVLSCSAMSDSLQPYGLQPTRLLYPWDCPNKITGVDCHFLLRGPSPPGIVHTSTAYPALQADSLPLSH